MIDNKDTNDDTFHINNSAIMNQVIHVLDILESHGVVTLKARGNSIPNAVAVANFINDDTLKEQVKIQKIDLDTVEAVGIGKMISTIQIVIKKI